MNCEQVRESLLARLYEALEPSEERVLDDHLAGCTACRDALEAAKGQRELLAEAARLTAEDMTFESPPPRRRLVRRPWLAAAASLLVAAVGLLAYRHLERAPVFDRHPRLVVQGPVAISPDAPAEFMVLTETIDGDALSADVSAEVVDLTGRRLVTRALRTEDGVGRIELPPGLGKPGERLGVRVRAAFDSATVKAETLLVRDGSRLLARVSTDKPLYRPGEPIRARAVVLERFRLTPAGSHHVQLKLLDPKGNQVARAPVPTKGGVGAFTFGLPAEAAGGRYRLLLSDPEEKFPEVERTITVRSYRVPRLKTDLELDRDSYGPGAVGKAYVSVERAEGGVPVGAAVTATVTVDGVEVSKATYSVGPDGALTVPFSLPDEIESGRGQLALVISDGGVVESAAKTIPISLGRLDVELLPEGGELVEGLQSRVYFSVRDPVGEPADLVADVVDSTGAKVAEARVDVLGMGRFELTPRPGERYSLVAREPAGLTLSGAAIATVADGVALRSMDDVAGAGGSVRVEVASTIPGEHVVAAWCRGVLVAQESVDLARAELATVDLRPTDDVGGVFRVTVLDPAGRPRAERLISRKPVRRISVNVHADAESYTPGEPVKLRLRTRDERGTPVPATLGVSVVDQAVLVLANDEDTPSLPMHFLLGLEVSELERVELFAEGSDGARAVDLLLGVQGWRRFAWKDAESFLAAHPVAGPRVLGAGASSDGLVRVDTLAQAREAAYWDFRDADDRTLAATAILIAGALLGGFVLLAVRRPKVALVMGAVAVPVVLAFVVLAQGAAEKMVAMEPGTTEAAVVDVVARRTVPVNGQELVLVDASTAQFDGVPLDRFVTFDFDVEVLSGAAVYFGTAGGGGGAGIRLEAGLLDELPVLKDRPQLGYLFMYQIFTREYSHQRSSDDGARKDFSEVLYWNPNLVTDADGRATIEFQTSDSITTFEVGVDAHDGRGALASAASSIVNKVPFYVEPKLPVALSTGDRLRLPVAVANDTKEPLDAAVTLGGIGELLALEGDASRKLRVEAGARTRAVYRLTAGSGRGTVALTLTAKAPGVLDDIVTREIPIEPRGYPVEVARAGVVEKVDAADFVLPPQMIRESLTGSLRLYPSMLSSLTDGLESMLAAPHGCFEQASSTTYPNVLILTYLQESGDVVAPAVARTARSHLGRGYGMLTGYECERRGFEWFGNDPGHEGLTAYGLMEFTDMGRVFDVDSEMVERTRKWILGRRDGKGGFRLNGNSLHSWVGSREISDAYVTWALTEAGVTEEIEGELDLVEKRARESEDPYLVALSALSLQKVGRPGAKALVGKLAELQQPDGRLWGKTTSIVASRGKNLDVETTALAAVAFLRDPTQLARGEQAVRWILEQRRGGGGFGATQATVLALRALVEHGRLARRTASAHDLSVFVNGQPVADRKVAEGEQGVILFEREILKGLVPGRNEIEVRTTGEEVLPWALSLSYHTLVPPSDPTCAVGIETRLAAREVAEGETVGLEVTIQNREDAAIPMVLARIGLPAGLVPRPDQLEELRKAGAVDFFETRPREIALYLRGMSAKQVRKLRLDLVADVPGDFEGPATSAYLYYTDDVKTWSAPLTVRVK